MTGTSDTTKCILLICGPPGCGKTSIARELAVEFNRKHIRSVIVSYDDDNDPQLILFEDWNDYSYRFNRNIHMGTVEAKLKESCVDLVIVDDIMYLCSMRRELYVLARSSKASFVCIQLFASLPTALYRNNFREGKARISENVVKKIHAAFENLDTKRTAERYSIIVSTDNGVKNGSHDESGNHVGKNGNYASFEILSAIQDLYLMSIRRQRKQEMFCNDLSEQVRNKVSNYTPYMHKLDLFLREQIGIVIKYLNSVGSCQELQKKVRMVKSEILESFKSEIKCKNYQLSPAEIGDTFRKYRLVFQGKIDEIYKQV